ncbi:glycosyltransferase [Candidatus Woesearchaeota archaeon]|nr:glycosyltransferase [Candidatus Woesearchaeota archaeon]
MNKPTVDIIIPVYYGNLDEIEPSVKKQILFYNKYLNDYKWSIVIGINGPKDRIFDLAKRLSKKYKNVKYHYTSTPGRGATLKDAWVNTKADFVSYMDVDLSTNLDCFPALLKELNNGYDVVVGSKYISGSEIKRIPLRYIISKVYNTLFTKLILNAKFTDAQCGFKSMRRKAAEELMPKIKDNGWFWDTEMLYLAQKYNYKIKEIPVRWIEDPNSGVRMAKTVVLFLKNMINLRLRKLTR